MEPSGNGNASRKLPPGDWPVAVIARLPVSGKKGNRAGKYRRDDERSGSPKTSSSWETGILSTGFSGSICTPNP